VDTELSERMRRHGRVLLLDDLRVRSSARRWNRCLLVSSLLFASNYAWVRLFHRPLWQSFPSVREPARGARAPRWRWRHRLAAACLGLALVGGIGLLGYDAFAPWSNAFGTTYWYGPPRPKQIALTFDDGPEEPYTSEVLAILRREHVKATFFLIGENVRRFPETALRIVREGHVVANHSDTHPPALALDPEDVVRAEVDRAERTIHAVTGVYPHLFRPPQGIRSPWLLETLREDSLVAVTWDDAARDWERRSAADLERRAVAEATPGAIVLLHDGLNLDHHADRSSTVRALPEIIRRAPGAAGLGSSRAPRPDALPHHPAKRSVAATSARLLGGSKALCPLSGVITRSASGQARCRAQALSRAHTTS
jgi:peptidoglycan/xylan/chitin deacetylase (PgdA/CDA1 family)